MIYTLKKKKLEEMHPFAFHVITYKYIYIKTSFNPRKKPFQRTEKSPGKKKNPLDHHVYTKFANPM